MFQWLQSLLPEFPRYGYVIVFIVVFLNNLGAPLPGETVLLGAGFVLGRAEGSLWQPMLAGTVASTLGGLCAFWIGRRLGHSGIAKLHWLHLTPERKKWPERLFKRYGAKLVFFVRFIAMFPPVVANVLAGTTTMRWKTFLFYDLTGSAAYSVVYILIGLFFGERWGLLGTWLGATAGYWILIAVLITILFVTFRHFLMGHLVHLFPDKKRR